MTGGAWQDGLDGVRTTGRFGHCVRATTRVTTQQLSVIRTAQVQRQTLVTVVDNDEVGWSWDNLGSPPLQGIAPSGDIACRAGQGWWQDPAGWGEDGPPVPDAGSEGTTVGWFP